jgi:hypothetical protein
MMADDLDLRAESSLVFQVGFPERNAAAMMRSCGNGVEYALTQLAVTPMGGAALIDTFGSLSVEAQGRDDAVLV